MPKYRPRATMKYTKNTRARTRTAERRCLHGCYHDLVLQGHTGGCFRRVSLFAVLAGNVPKTGTRARATPPPLLRCRLFLRRETAKGVRSHTGRFFRRGVFALPEVLRIMRGAYAGGTRAHRTEMLHPCAAATARTAADSPLLRKAAQRPQKRPQRCQEPPDVHGHTRRRRPYSPHRSPPRRTIAPPSRRRLTSVY